MKSTKSTSSAKARYQASGRAGGVGICSKSEIPTIAQRTDALLRGLDMILKHHNAKLPIRLALNEQCHSYLDSTNDEMVWLKRCKFLLTFPLARYLRNELPPKPDAEFKFTGKLRIWVKNRLNAFSRTNTHLWYSWFQAKRATLPLSEDIVEKTYDTHLETLTRQDPGDDLTIGRIFNDRTFKKVLEDVKNSVEAYLKDSTPFEELNPKTSACFEHGRKFGGQSRTLREFIDLPTYSTEEKSRLCSEPELFDMVYRPYVYTHKGIQSNFLQTRYMPYGEYEWSRIGTMSADLDLKDPLNCTIQAVLEPNKIRVISKGNAIPYYSCRPLQKALFEALKGIESFVLISRPLSPTDLLPLFKKAKKDWNWFSIDYSAATDGLSWKYSGRILNHIISGLEPRQQEIANRVLGPHNLHYPRMSDSPGCVAFKGTQTNGQLMGSILSFPILCLANLGVYLDAMSYYQTEFEDWTDEERLEAVKINGDDMVYAAPPEYWDTHVEIGKKVGLEMSIGKAYLHREYLNINSQSFHFPLHKLEEGKKDNRRISMINFLNVGLFFGQHKVQGKHERREGSSTAESHHLDRGGLVVNINKVLEGALPNKTCAVLSEFLKTHKEEIKAECLIKTYTGRPHHRNLFISEKLGGMGVSAPDGWFYRIKNDDIYVAHGFLKRFPGVQYTTERPLPGYPLATLDEPSVPWAIVGEADAVQHTPEHRIKIKQIKKLCKSPAFEFYVPYSGCLYTTGSCPNKRVKTSRKSRVTETLDDLIALELSTDRTNIEVSEEETLLDLEDLARNIKGKPFSWHPSDAPSPTPSEYREDYQISYGFEVKKTFELKKRSDYVLSGLHPEHDFHVREKEETDRRERIIAEQQAYNNLSLGEREEIDRERAFSRRLQIKSLLTPWD